MNEQKFSITSDLRNDRIDGEDQKVVPKQADVPVTSYLDVCKLFINKSETEEEKKLPGIKTMLGGLLSVSE